MRLVSRKAVSMRIQTPGKISDNLYFLGSKSSCLYLVTGEEYALIGGGVTWVVPKLEAQLDAHGIDRSRIRYLIISHAHHDHCGAVPYLIRRYPHMEIITSEFCATVFGMPKQVALIREVNRQTLNALKKPNVHEGVSLDFDKLPVSRRVGDGDRLALGGDLTLNFFETPGHSKCSLTCYIPETETLFPADALPFPEDGRRELTVTANHDYDDYLHSLEKLAVLAVRRVCYEHGGVFEGSAIDEIVPRSIAATLQQRKRIQQRYGELQDLEALITELAAKYQTLELFRLVPDEIMRTIMRRMVKSALGMV